MATSMPMLLFIKEQHMTCLNSNLLTAPMDLSIQIGAAMVAMLSVPLGIRKRTVSSQRLSTLMCREVLVVKDLAGSQTITIAAFTK